MPVTGNTENLVTYTREEMSEVLAVQEILYGRNDTSPVPSFSRLDPRRLSEFHQDLLKVINYNIEVFGTNVLVRIFKSYDSNQLSKLKPAHERLIKALVIAVNLAREQPLYETKISLINSSLLFHITTMARSYTWHAPAQRAAINQTISAQILCMENPLQVNPDGSNTYIIKKPSNQLLLRGEHIVAVPVMTQQALEAQARALVLVEQNTQKESKLEELKKKRAELEAARQARSTTDKNPSAARGPSSVTPNTLFKASRPSTPTAVIDENTSAAASALTLASSMSN